MAQTKIGACLIASKKIGCTIDEYNDKINIGLKWCFCCKSWKPNNEFSIDKSRYDKLNAKCNECRKQTYHDSYIKTGIIISKKGTRFTEIRDGDKGQARHRVNHLIEIGYIPKANDLPCSICGHVWVKGEKRHDYHHSGGYGIYHHETVISVCTKCHSNIHKKLKNGKN